MRIALITPGFSAHADDWAIPALLNLARTLAQTHEIHVFSQRYPAQGIYHIEGLMHHAIGGGQKFGLPSARIWLHTTQAIIRQHRQTPFDLLHAFWADEAGFSAALAGAWLKQPVVVSLGGGELCRLPDIHYGAQRFLARRLTTRYALTQAVLVTAGSNYQLDLCRAHNIPELKLRLAPLGVDTNLFQPAPQINQIPWPTRQGRQNSPPKGQSKIHAQMGSPKSKISHPTLVQAASLLPVKNQPLLLQVLSLVKQELPQIILNLAGTGPLKEKLTSLAEKLGLNQNIVWQQLTYPRMAQLYQESHLYLQTSRHESQGLAVLEAMACGLPVVGTPVGVVRDVACLPPQTSVETLAAQVIRIFSDESHYQELCQQARQISESRYSLPITTRVFSEIYAAAVLNAL